jgi:transglutaminase-like putative cysteine protease
VIYEVRHVTRYRYEPPVAANRCMLRLLPRSMDGQDVLSGAVEVKPRPSEMEERADVFGNRVVRMRIDTAHRELVIRSTAKVRVERKAPPAPELTPAWEDVARDAAASLSLATDSPAYGLYPSRLVGVYEPITAYARVSFPHSAPLYEAALDLNRRINGDFAYDKTATDVWTPPEEAFAKRGGVCQDFAHIMIAALRGLGLAAFYVSGYIRTIPPPGRPRLVGADASHAWVQVWCGREFGWLGLDPTNAIPVGDDHIVIAIGRDYADVAPVEGVIVSSGRQRLDVAVDVAPATA